MNHVTFETAKRLKAAGFPQPIPAWGQVWFTAVGSKLLVSHGGIAGNAEWTNLNEVYFAPTATDILKELGYKWTLRFNGPKWHCESKSEILPGIMNFTGHSGFAHENPAEACAMAYLRMNEKK